ncbi:excalibur calcium-binding domain-containing protein [Actinoplanes subglobosus]|uniref:Excalibur calcium-binding domain-containing protein n=1 Tax=Actinoplanes subglobosus TaxID=1547892 RepID=A0ABV8J9A4_9ACTN
MPNLDRRNRRDYILMGVFAFLLLGCIVPAKLIGSTGEAETGTERPAITPTRTTRPSTTATSDASITDGTGPEANATSTEEPSTAATTLPPTKKPTKKATTKPAPEITEEDEEEDSYYANCSAARAAGAAPLYAGEPGYRRALDRDGDGVACDS